MSIIVKKWNFKKQEYEDYELPEDCPLICHNMEQIINCANCRKKTKFGKSYSSKAIHNEYGFGYPVCEECYKKELENERKYKEYV
ncbi:hypothetical protein HG452_000615 [Candidatus Saccharibacteria bacterium]|nr:hypothetical protein [Candidatus Saccharibacteria bacterium]